MLGKVAERFRRTNWKSVQELADELWAVFHRPMKIEPSQIVINQPANTDESPIEITRPTTGITTPNIVVNGGSSSTGGGGSGGGGIDLGSITFPQQDVTNINLSVPPPSNNPFMLHGVVQAKSGSGGYKVQCYARDPATAPPLGTLDVTFPGLSDDDTIPAETVVPVIAFPVTSGATTTIAAAVGYVAVFADQGGP